MSLEMNYTAVKAISFRTAWLLINILRIDIGKQTELLQKERGCRRHPLSKFNRARMA